MYSFANDAWLLFEESHTLQLEQQVIIDVRIWLI
jgi:hypothetical protein